MIHLIEEISINGQGGRLGSPFCGGYIYDINLQVAKGDEGSSTVSVSLVNPSGNYSFDPKQLNMSSAYTIDIGGTRMNMYPKKLRRKRSSSGSVMEIEFTDGSYRLDKYFVGLHKKHGWNPKFGSPKSPYLANLPCFIIVGREIHPCDVNFDGVLDNIKDIADPCHPCVQENSQFLKRQLIDCKKMSKYNVFEVKYNFTELIEAAQAKGFRFRDAKDPNPAFLNNHTGSLREVLSAWCNDFGWIFLWENDQISFIDLRTIPAINASISHFCPHITDYEEEFSLDGTFDSVILTNFTRGGHDQNYSCQQAVYLSDLVPLDQKNAPIGALDIDNSVDEDAAGLAYYSKELRNLYYLFHKYKMHSPEKYKAGTEIKELGLHILTDALTVEADTGGPLGDISIEPSTSLQQPAFNHRKGLNDPPPNPRNTRFLDAPNVGNLQAAKTKIEANQKYLEIFKLLEPEVQWKIAANVDRYFFFIGHYDQDVDGAHYEREKDYAENFMGRYHVFVPNLGDQRQKDFFEDHTFYIEESCGARVIRNDDRVSYRFLGESGGDSLQYFNAEHDQEGNLPTLSHLPFARFLQVTNSMESASFSNITLPKLILIEKQAQGFYPAGNVQKSADTGSIFPNSGDNWFIQDPALKARAFTYFIRGFPAVTNEAGENISRLGINSSHINIDRSKTFIFVGYAPGPDAFQYTRVSGYSPLAQTPSESHFNGSPIQLEIDPITRQPSTEPIYQYPDLLCLPIGLGGRGICEKGVFTTPVGQFKFYFPTYGNYSCILEKTRQVIKRIEKYESVLTSGTCSQDKTLSLNVQTLNITDEDITKFNKVGANTCIYDSKAISDYHIKHVKNLSAGQKTPLIKKTFTISGITSGTPGIREGLQSISISASEQGIRSTYSFGTTHMKPANPSVYSTAEHKFEVKHSTGSGTENIVGPLKNPS